MLANVAGFHRTGILPALVLCECEGRGEGVCEGILGDEGVRVGWREETQRGPDLKFHAAAPAHH